MVRRNSGSVVVEACLIIPFFLFFVLAVGELLMLLLAEARIHQSLMEAADYTAQYCYLENKLLENTENQASAIVNTVILTKQFHTYLGDDFYVEKTIQNGKYGILLSIQADTKNKKIFTVKADCYADINIPVLGNYYLKLSDVVKKKAFVGYDQNEEEQEIYVYVTPNQEVYHMSRSCSHLSVSVQEKEEWQKGNYTPCSFCGNAQGTGSIYVSKTTNVYHSRRDCSGLKRTVIRVKQKEVGNLSPCQRCGR